MAKNKKINVLMALQDKFTKPLGTTTKELQKSRLEIKKGHQELNKWGSKANEVFKGVASKAVNLTKNVAKIGTAMAGAAAALGFNEAFNMETYKAQLETATGDTQKAAKIMKYAIDMANKTPFEGGQLVEAAAKFEAMGMSAEQWLGRAGDMAGATGKDLIDATDAITDAMYGEWEALENFGIKGVENMDDLVNVMNSRFSGGMEKLAGTTKGIWSTVTGVAKNSLAKMVGIMDDGTVRSGSALDLLRQKLTLVADKFVQWQNDGTIDRISEKLTVGLSKGIDLAKKGFEKLSAAMSWTKDNAGWLIPLLSGIVGIFVAFNVISTVVKLWKSYQAIAKAVTAAQGVLNFVMNENPIGLVAVAIGALIAAGVALYMNWDTIKEKALELWAKIEEAFSGIKEKIISPFREAKAEFDEFFNGIGNKLSALKEKAANVPVIGSIFKDKTSGHATGSSYFKGGLTRVNEGGRGELITLPSGSKILPNSETKKALGTTNNYNINVTVTGGEDPHKTGRIIAEEILKALPVV